MCCTEDEVLLGEGDDVWAGVGRLWVTWLARDECSCHQCFTVFNRHEVRGRICPICWGGDPREWLCRSAGGRVRSFRAGYDGDRGNVPPEVLAAESLTASDDDSVTESVSDSSGTSDDGSSDGGSGGA